MDALMEMIQKLSTKELESDVSRPEAEKANSATVTATEERPTICEISDNRIYLRYTGRYLRLRGFVV